MEKNGGIVAKSDSRLCGDSSVLEFIRGIKGSNPRPSVKP